MTSVIASAASLILLQIAVPQARAQDELHQSPVQTVQVQIDGKRSHDERDPYRLLIGIREGDLFDRQRVRVGMDNLYKTQLFDDIDVRYDKNQDASINLYFFLHRKRVIHRVDLTPVAGLRRRELRNALVAVKGGMTYGDGLVQKGVAELQDYLQNQGYFHAHVGCRTTPAADQHEIDLHFDIQSGAKTKLHRLEVTVDEQQMEKLIRPLFHGIVFYVPANMEKTKQKAVALLKAQNYFFPEISISDQRRDGSASEVDVSVKVNCGFKYIFDFSGMKPKMDLIRSVWEKKVDEKRAEDESQARIVNYLNNAGYIRSQVQSEVVVKDHTKHVIFSVVRDRRYRIGKIAFAGNEHVPESKLRSIIRSSSLLFEKLLWLRGSTLFANLQVLQLFYYYQGFTDVQISWEPSFHGTKADILFRIEENQQNLIAAVHFTGNRSFAEETLLAQIKSKPGGPFIQRQVSEDVYRLQNYYQDNGFADATVSFELSPALPRVLAIKINEGVRQHLGDFIIIGGSQTQRNLIRKLLPMKKGDPLARDKIDALQGDLENSTLFSQIKVEPMRIAADASDILVNVTPDRSRSFGFGLGWVERQELGVRGTLDYQEKNIFNSISTLSAMLQLTLTGNFKVDPLARRGVLAVDTPFFLKDKLHSTVNVWEENEIFPSYNYNRYGAGFSFIKYFRDNVYAMASLKWYRTTLTSLSIPASGVDQLNVPFDTTACTFSFARENRNDPFNPSSGTFLSADLKVGLPLFQKDYTFLKFFWNYQWHHSFLDNGVLSLSFRNGIGFGDMSITERFFAGGSHSFRGTSNDRLGPLYIDPQTGQSWPEGGNVLVLLNCEATFPLVLLPFKALYYSLFLDVGNVYAVSSQLDFGNLEKAIGFALKYRTPLGPIRFGFAYNLRPTFTPHFLFHLGIGNVY